SYIAPVQRTQPVLLSGRDLGRRRSRASGSKGSTEDSRARIVAHLWVGTVRVSKFIGCEKKKNGARPGGPRRNLLRKFRPSRGRGAAGSVLWTHKSDLRKYVVRPGRKFKDGRKTYSAGYPSHCSC